MREFSFVQTDGDFLSVRGVSIPGGRDPYPLLPCLFSLLFLWALSACVIPLPAWAAGLQQGEEVRIDADRFHFDEQRRLYVAEGHVHFQSGSMRLTCDQAEYSDLTGGFSASGNVVFTDEVGTVLCDRVEGNIRTGLGTFYVADMDNVKGEYSLKGDQVDKVEDETYVVKNGSISECGGRRPLWEIRGKNIRVTRDEYATTRHMTLWIGGVPVLYSPYFLLPLKTERQSGFLAPVFGSGGRSGRSVGLDYFWAIDSNQDATFSYEYLQYNGNRFGLQYRYALSQEVRGAVFGRYIHDRNADRESTRIGMKEDRWEAGITHYANLQDRVYGGIFVDAFSDGLYLSDFAASSEARVQSNGQSDISLVNRWAGGNLSVDFRYYQEMGVQRAMTTRQSLPEIRLDLVPARTLSSNWFFALDSGFTNFYREEEYQSTFSPGISSDPATLSPVTPGQVANVRKLADAGFDPDTALRYQGVKGRRLDLFPRLSLPLDPLPYLVFTPRAGYQETLYNRGAQREDFVERGVLDAGFDLTTRLHRDFSFGASGFLRHILEPEVSYDYRPDQNQQGIPIYDESDRVDPVDAVHFRVINRFLLARGGDQAPDGKEGAEEERREIATLKLDGLYDRLVPEQRFRSITGELDLNLTDDLYIEINSRYGLPSHDFEGLNIDLKCRIGEALSLQVGRRYSDRIPLDPNRPTGGGASRTIGGNDILQGLENEGISFWTSAVNWEPTKRFSMHLSGYFNARDDTGDDQSFQMSYQTECWGAMLTVSRYDDAVLNDHTQELEIDRVNRIHLFFTIKSLHLSLFSMEPK